MTNFKIFNKGLRTARRRGGIVAGLWIIEWVFALVVITPFVLMVGKDFLYSVAGESLGRFHYVHLGDILFKYRETLAGMTGWLAAPLALFLLLSVFLNGGIVGRIVAEGERTTLQSFFSDSGKYFFRFLRVFLLSLPVYALVFGVLLKGMWMPLDLWIKNAAGERDVLIASNLKLLLGLAALSVVQMFFGYVKIDLVFRNGTKVIRAAVLMSVFLSRRFFKAWGLYLMTALLMIAACAVFLWGTGVLPDSGPAAPWAGLLWAQVFVLARLWMKILFFTTEYQFYRTPEFP